VSRHPSRVVLVAALLGVLTTVPSHATSSAVPSTAVPGAHAEACQDLRMDGASRMTLVSTHTGRHRSGGFTSVGRAWLYAVPGTDVRCVVADARGARVGRRARTDIAYSVGHETLQSGVIVVDTGETLPLSDEVSRSGGGTGRTSLLADGGPLSETERVPADAAESLPPELAGLAGHEVTLTTSSVEVRFYPTAWTTTRLARPMTAAAASRKQAAEVARARKAFESRVATARTERDDTLAQAATATGLTAAWLKWTGTWSYEEATASARSVFRASRAAAREHARQARRGVDVRQAYDHEIRLTVPLR
jgi:hypothetical protein